MINTQIAKNCIVLLGSLLLSFNGYSQSLRWIDGYRLKANVGLSLGTEVLLFPPASSFTPSSSPFSLQRSSFGVLGGISIQNVNKRFGIDMGMKYCRFLKTNIDHQYFFNTSVLLTYKLFYIQKKPFKLGIGVARSSYKINPWYGCPYCFPYNFALSIQQEIWKINIELLLSTSIGDNYTGLHMPYSINYYTIVSIGVNYKFYLKQKTKYED